MPYLAIDTSNYALSIAVGDDQECLGEASTFVDRNHSNRLMPLIEALLAQLEVPPDQITGLIVGKGPGSYTGVRIGVTAAKTMAWALQVPLAGVSSLLAMAQTARLPGFLTCPLIDARRRQVYGCAAAAAEDNRLLIEEAIWPLDAFLEQVRSLSLPAVFVGTGAKLQRESIQSVLGERAYFAPPLSTGFARALHLLELGSSRLRSGQTEDPYTFEPDYLQVAEAEAKLKKQAEQQKESSR